MNEITLGSADSTVTSLAYELAESHIPGSETAAVNKSKGLVSGGETLDRRVEAAVTVAEAVDGRRTD